MHSLSFSFPNFIFSSGIIEMIDVQEANLSTPFVMERTYKKSVFDYTNGSYSFDVCWVLSFSLINGSMICLTTLPIMEESYSLY